MGKSTALTLFLGISVLFLFSFSSRDHHSPGSIVVKTEKVYAPQSGMTYFFYYVRANDYYQSNSASSLQYIDNDTGCVRSPGNCAAVGAKERVVILPVDDTK